MTVCSIGYVYIIDVIIDERIDSSKLANNSIPFHKSALLHKRIMLIPQ